MNPHTLHLRRLTLASAVVLAVGVPAIAQAECPHGPGGGGEESVLDEDLALSSAMAISDQGTTKTRTLSDDDGDSHTIVTTRGVKAAGDVTGDLLTADGTAASGVTATLRYRTRKVDDHSPRFKGILTIKTDGGRIRARISGRIGSDGGLDGRLGGARGKGDFKGFRAHADADADITDSSLALDLDGDYGYADASGGDRRPPRGPHSGQKGQDGPGSVGSGDDSQRARRR